MFWSVCHPLLQLYGGLLLSSKSHVISPIFLLQSCMTEYCMTKSRVSKCHRSPSDLVYCFCLSKIFLARRFLSLVFNNDHIFAKQILKSLALAGATW